MKSYWIELACPFCSSVGQYSALAQFDAHVATCKAKPTKEPTMKRFTAYRRNLSALVEAGHVQHTSDQRNADDQPQYEGVIWSDGTCTLRWRTAVASTSMFPSFAEMLKIHGHPEYGTRFVFHDDEPPAEWLETLRLYGYRLQDESKGELRFVEVEGKLGCTAMYMAKGTGLVQTLFDGSKS